MDSHNGDRSSKLNHSNSRGQADFNGQRGGAANGQSQADLAHWSSHGYLAKADGPEASNEKGERQIFVYVSLFLSIYLSI